MKKLIVILIPVAILGVGAILVVTGVVKIPGLSAKAKGKANQLYTTDKDAKVAQADKPSPAKTPPKNDSSKQSPPPSKVAANVTESKPEVGEKKLAKLWNDVEPGALKEMTKDWKDPELAAVLIKMDSGKVSEFLSALEPKRASSLSRELLKQGSQVPRETGS